MISLLDYTAGGRVFDFGDGTNTQGLKSSPCSDEHVKCVKYIETPFTRAKKIDTALPIFDV